MHTLTLTIFLASLLGSHHCAGMCGAFVALAVQSGNDRLTTPRWQLQAAYHAGRLLTYLALGAAAGALGHALNLAGSLVGLQRVAALGAGALMVAFGLLTLARVLGWRLAKLPLPKFLEKAVIAGQLAAARLLPLPRALVIGLLTTLLPCGWLWVFVATAAGQAAPGNGAMVMAVFWLGTLPILVGLGMSLGRLNHLLAARLPLITALVIVAVGLYTLTMRMAVPAAALGAVPSATAPTTGPAATPPCCAVRK
ncbi:MAG: sulfite exporter TauE/SafE family protein [Phycisphaerae bacterium]